jgi:hypothetical protein
MQLNKLFRRYSRELLMVFMALLLVAFLVPNTVQGCGEQARLQNRTHGEVYGQKVSDAQLASARRELDLLQTMGLSVASGPDAALDYHLMTAEAQHMGLRVGRQEVIEMLQRTQQSEQLLRYLQQTYGRSYNEIYDAIGRGLSVMRLMEIQASALVKSLPRQELDFRNQQQELATQVSLLDAHAFVGQVPEPTEAELQAFFAECKDRTTAHTDDQLVFGYRLPDRVQLEYLTVDPNAVLPKIKLKATQVRQYFDDNQIRYTKPDPNNVDQQGRPANVPMTFEEAQNEAKDDLRAARAIEEAQRLVNDMYDEARRPWNVGTDSEDGFATAPGGALESFEELRAKYSANYPVDYRKTELLDVQALALLPGLGTASLGDGAQRIDAKTLAFRVKGLLAKKDRDDRRPVLNLNEPAPVLMTRNLDMRAGRMRPYQAFLFRVVQVAPSAPPATLEEVRPQLVKDWKLMKAFEVARQQAEQLATKAREVGLAAALEQATELKAALQAAEQAVPADATVKPQYVQALQPITPDRLTRAGGMVTGIGPTRLIPKTLFQLADSLGTATAPAHLVAAVQDAKSFKWAVAEVQQLKPIYAGAFEQKLAQGDRALMRRFYEVWADPNSLQQRTGYKAVIQAGQTPDRPVE